MCHIDMHSFPDMFLFIFTIIISGLIIEINSFYYFLPRKEQHLHAAKFVFHFTHYMIIFY